MHELIQSDIISENFLSLPAEVFRFRSVKNTPPVDYCYSGVSLRFHARVDARYVVYDTAV